MLSFTNIRCERLAVVIIRLLIIRSAILPNEVLDERIRAGSIIRGVGERNDVLILANGEAFDMADLVQIFLGQFSAFPIFLL